MARIIEITDFAAPELDVYARATENQLVNRADPANALFIAESPLVIGRALDAGCVPVSFLMEPQHITGKGVPRAPAWCRSPGTCSVISPAATSSWWRTSWTPATRWRF